MNLYHLARPFIFSLFNPETAHDLVLSAGKSCQKIPLVDNILETFFRYDHPSLKSEVFGFQFDNPIGLAAGFDKNAELIPFFYSLGFGFTEIGSVTAQSRDGNEKPRLFRLPKDNAIINRMGLNNNGAEPVRKNLIGNRPYPVGVNITKTHDTSILGDGAIEDFLFSYTQLAPLADYVTLNISCPNTEEGKTFEDPAILNNLLSAVTEKNIRVPLLVKLSPDLEKMDLEKVLSVCFDHNINGYVISNTSSYRYNLRTADSKIQDIGKGGLSGKPIQKKSTEMVALVYHLTGGSVPIIGLGGIDSADSAYDKIKAGASLIQLYSGLVFQGPGLAKSINKGLVNLLEQDGVLLKNAVGVESERYIK